LTQANVVYLIANDPDKLQTGTNVILVLILANKNGPHSTLLRELAAHLLKPGQYGPVDWQAGYPQTINTATQR
jgi:hypothetical protein